MTWQAGEQVSFCDLGIWSGKMFPEPSQATEEKTLRPSSKKPSGSQSRKPPILKCLKKVGTPGGDTTMKWEDDGALRGECSMRNTGESPNVAVESRLSQILEATPHGKYCLSGKACQGILRRAERRGKALPPVLKAVLLTQSESGEDATEFDTTQITSKQNGSIPDFGKPCHTLNANAHVPCAILDMSHACDVIRDCGEVAPSLQARMGTGGNQIPLTYQKTTGTLSPGAHAGSYNGQDAYNDMLVVSSEISPALRAKANDPYRTDMAAYVASVDCRNFTEGGEINGTLQAKESEGQSLNLNNTVRQNMVIRRLTPLECERLQGFPDGWTDIGDWVKTDKRGRKIKVKGSADSPRYKALGNSIALPPWKWLLKRLCGNYERDATMASLFDGIGGFPLIWEQLNGRGTCLWASEIEEFPIAVTKRRFGTVEKPGDMGRFLFPYGKDEL